MLEKITAIINLVRFILLNFIFPLTLVVGAVIWRGASPLTTVAVAATGAVCLYEYYKTYHP